MSCISLRTKGDYCNQLQLCKRLLKRDKKCTISKSIYNQDEEKEKSSGLMQICVNALLYGGLLSKARFLEMERNCWFLRFFLFFFPDSDFWKISVEQILFSYF